ncbi:hypothetical protein [Streptomyces aureus]|uniref:hypothetical protein n=1 Tax=Streptomyces aureus TaxID=193461 RepID=UPI00055A08CC|nr:hypothetical protein [Streptomyces aureus]
MSGHDIANAALAIAVLLCAAAAIYRACVRPPTRTRVTVMPAALTPAAGQQLAPEDEDYLSSLSARMDACGPAATDHYSEGNQ